MAVGVAAWLVGCDTAQSVLSPAGPESGAVSIIALTMFLGATAIFAAVLLLLWLSGRGHNRRLLAGPRLILIGGTALPVAALSALLVFGLLLERWTIADEGEAFTIRVTGKQWWWHVAYLDDAGETVAVTANEIHIPVTRSVRFELVSADVIHSFWIPALGGKLDMIPGRTNVVVLEADRPGIYRGQCAEFCGDQHALMAFMVVAEEDQVFEAWLRRQATDAEPSRGDLAAQGAAVFAEQGCGACHTVRGTGAAGAIGPDLTHVGGRLTIAAGTLTNNAGTLAGWIADAQAIKPASRMPSFDDLTGVELRALAAYLGELR